MKRFLPAFFVMFLLAQQVLAFHFANATFSSRRGDVFHVYLNGRLMNMTASNFVRLEQVPAGQHDVEIRVLRPRFPVSVRQRLFFDPGLESNFVLSGPNRRGGYVLNKVSAAPLPPPVYAPAPPAYPPPVAQPLPDSYYQYHHGNQCPNLFTRAQADQLLQSIAARSFESDKLTIAKQAVSGGSILAEDVRRIMSVFTYESSRLEFAKFAYSYTCDRQNYYLVNDGFHYSSSIDELDRFLGRR